ncbi:hypothetical protein [Corallococcus sicarius]|uniref:hypothetical protein n=1 Tax=Corallococcus sicarius TaxID=2316726 RepID=UPI0013158411|nr:hypothetical protein [Corallococcus sicarius]
MPFRVQHPAARQNRFIPDTFFDPTGFGIHAPTAFDGGGNVARDDGAGDCVGIVCAPF